MFLTTAELGIWPSIRAKATASPADRTLFASATMPRYLVIIVGADEPMKAI
jgi:hypothetical protein